MFLLSILEVVTELGDKLVTRVPREADLEVLESKKPRMIPIPGLGISKQWGQMTVKRVWTKITVGYGLDGVMFAVNEQLPALVESKAAIEARKLIGAGIESGEEMLSASTTDKLWNMNPFAEMAGVKAEEE